MYTRGGRRRDNENIAAKIPITLRESYTVYTYNPHTDIFTRPCGSSPATYTYTHTHTARRIMHVCINGHEQLYIYTRGGRRYVITNRAFSQLNNANENVSAATRRRPSAFIILTLLAAHYYITYQPHGKNIRVGRRRGGKFIPRGV